ncbi:hypothetical protein FGSG_13397 [Fusarium graminearum PH-1]|uniref:Chromosome 2, complete genome n=1 Tax=Gibberella zeae (strain ATCC MYA-4620 / CBS 123657 / FGSC 9075 / NRRL 31084 / PH-1) TaxID=229533 RepID=I1S967_GIBZE|nr:hypothetical protein FGSG_13397 [Fusarium graminearum PH-1]ESU15068.1 hypothetical protein FGSG_13397 [Fusarium graminearum PH-1]CEF76602.1 unnamed protein product [Fusarium graminearum]|eukprot:XP_011320493.1 hypothetical protein FGSG_13397 [Fusarium graminearum PH-1]
MDTFRAGLEGKRLPSSKLRLPTTSNFLTRSKRKRPVVSAPIGPVKNSRGADFVRSDTLIIVPTIKDCCSDDSSSDKENAQAIKTTRRISASFSTHGSLASPPTVAKSGLTATSSHQSLLSAAPIKPLPTTASFTNFSRKTLANSSSYGVYPTVDTIFQDENVPPPDHKEVAPAETVSSTMNKSRLPKSRTLTVLSEIRSSISRTSMNSKPSSPRPLADQSRKASSSSTSSLLTSSSSRLCLPGYSSTSASRTNSTSTLVTELLPKPDQITSSQPSAYWSGRFVSLHDRFLTEEFSTEGAVSKDSSSDNSFRAFVMKTDRAAVNSRPTHLSHSTTTSALTSLTVTKPRNKTSTKDARCLRVFHHLENLCITIEARRSLLAWQQTYARRMDKPSLLPQGGSMEHKSLMGRIFSGGKGTSGNTRHSLPAMNGPSGLPVSKKRPSLASKQRGKRLSFN